MWHSVWRFGLIFSNGFEREVCDHTLFLSLGQGGESLFLSIVKFYQLVQKRRAVEKIKIGGKRDGGVFEFPATVVYPPRSHKKGTKIILIIREKTRAL